MNTNANAPRILDNCRTRERILADIADWESGRRGTVGQPPDGLNYPDAMRAAVATLDAKLLAHATLCCACLAGGYTTHLVKFIASQAAQRSST